jgi:hypothetical protein
MKQFVIDELRPEDFEKLKKYLDDNLGASTMDGLYWLQIEKAILSDLQNDHGECQPYYFAIDLESDRMMIELLVRTKNRVRCPCMAYATEAQRVWLMRQMDAMLEKLEITV